VKASGSAHTMQMSSMAAGDYFTRGLAALLVGQAVQKHGPVAGTAAAVHPPPPPLVLVGRLASSGACEKNWDRPAAQMHRSKPLQAAARRRPLRARRLAACSLAQILAQRSHAAAARGGLTCGAAQRRPVALAHPVHPAALPRRQVAIGSTENACRMLPPADRAAFWVPPARWALGRPAAAEGRLCAVMAHLPLSPG